MRKQIEKSYGMPIILNKNIKDREGKYIVFCKNKKHLADIKETVIEWFKTAGFKDIHTYEVYSNYEKKNAEYKAFCNDTSHSLKLMFCVDMLNEGLHLENISGVLLLRPTRSSIVWHQQIGRAIEANNTSTPVIIDAVNNFFSVGQGMKLLREIKDVIAREKESDPNFDDSGLDDIDTFFVLEQVIEIQEMFRAIEERLEGSWEEGLRHFDKYVKEHDGDVLVPLRYKDDDGFPIGNWVSHRRKEYKDGILKQDRIAELEKRRFVWNSVLYNFENSAKAFSEYYNKYKKYPSYRSKNPNEKRLGRLLYKEKMQMRDNNITYPRWKEEIINKYLPEFSCEYEKDRLFNEFLYYVKLYKEKYGHVNIKTNDVIAGYNIGMKRSTLSRHNCYNSLSKHQLNELKDLGVYLGNKNDKQFDGTMELARQAVKEGVVINKTNSKYKDKNIYSWVHNVVKRRYENNNLSLGEIKIVEKLVGRLLNDIFNKKQGRVKIMDITENIEVGLFKSKCEAARVMREKYNVRINDSIIRNHLTGKITTPYMGRFMFYYEDEKATN